MIACPKCGFEQPEDKFCASCGVNMAVFVQPRQGLVETLLRSTAFYALVIGSLVVAALIYVQQKMEGALETTPSQDAAQVDYIESKPFATAAPNGSPAAPTSLFGGVKPGLSPKPSPGVQAQGSQTPQPVSESQEKPSIRFDILQLTADLMERLSYEADTRLSFGRYSVSIIPRYVGQYTIVSRERNFKSIMAETLPLSTQQPTVVFKGTRNQKFVEFIGYEIQLSPLRVRGETLEMKIQIKRNFPDYIANPQDPKIQSQSFDETLAIPKGAVVAISGLVPLKQLIEPEHELYKNSFLKILAEQPFQNGDEDYVFVFAPINFEKLQ